MILKDILAISGEPGLFKFIAQGKNAIIVEHLETGKRSSAFSSAKVSSLEDISVFTENEDISLGKVFDRIFEKENGGPSIDPKASANDLKKYFEEVLPDYSKDRVYMSDIKKLFTWYNILHKKNLLVKEEPEKVAEDKEQPVVKKEIKKSTSKPKKSKE
jgi:hypothetical protein